MMEPQLLMMNLMVQVVKVTAVLAVLYALILTLSPLRSILDSYALRLSLETRGLEVLPDLEDRISLLDQRIKALTPADVEFRLSKIERAIQVGEVQPEDLVALQEMRDDMAVLKSNVFADPQQVIEFKELQSEYKKLTAGLERTMDEDDIERELSFIRNLYYATLALGSILVGLISIFWFAGGRQAREVGAEDARAG